jgi:hypothetical protein
VTTSNRSYLTRAEYLAAQTATVDDQHKTFEQRMLEYMQRREAYWGFEQSLAEMRDFLEANRD